MIATSTLHKKAFSAYLRTGAPIQKALKPVRQTTHYIWRTRGDEKVRSSHAQNNGRVFAWKDPRPTGHPGDDYGCRCVAEPVSAHAQEFMEITLQGVYDTGEEWSSADFVSHYRNSNGQAVTLRETGHLVKVVRAYMEVVEENLKDQIATAARDSLGEKFVYDFVSAYKMTSLVFSLGRTTIGGVFSGNSIVDGNSLIVGGRIEFFQNDEFADPTDFGFEPFEPYPITDKWSGTLVARINTDPNFSDYVYRP